MANGRTLREEMFIKAWKLKLFKDVSSYEQRRHISESYCNALAFYASLLVPLPAPGPTQARLEKKIDKSRKIADCDAAQVNFISDNDTRVEFLAAAKRDTTVGFHNAAVNYFDRGDHQNVAGAKLSAGRAGPHAADLALVLTMRLNGELLLRHFSRASSGAYFSSNLVRASQLNLDC
jgi:hypothetical protein